MDMGAGMKLKTAEQGRKLEVEQHVYSLIEIILGAV